MPFWKVKLEQKAEKELNKLLLKKSISNADLKVLIRWVDEMEEFGPSHIENSKEWRDHALEREWIGYHSSAFSHSGRIIYKVLDNLIIVLVAKVTNDHNYKKDS